MDSTAFCLPEWGLENDQNASVRVLSVQTSKHITPIHIAALCGEEAVLTLIKDFDCDTTVRGGLGSRSLLHMACGGGNVSLVPTLIREHKADINARDDQNNMPIHVAAFCGNEDAVLALIKEFGCDPTVRGYKHISLLHSACITGKAKVVKVLGRIISPLVVNDNGDTPLHMCSSRDHSECVEALLLVNAPLLVRNKKGHNVIDVSRGKAIKNT